jgi:hypothetical protein
MPNRSSGGILKNDGEVRELEIGCKFEGAGLEGCSAFILI